MTRAAAKKAVMAGHEGTFLVFRDSVDRFEFVECWCTPPPAHTNSRTNNILARTGHTHTHTHTHTHSPIPVLPLVSACVPYVAACSLCRCVIAVKEQGEVSYYPIKVQKVSTSDLKNPKPQSVVYTFGGKVHSQVRRDAQHV